MKNSKVKDIKFYPKNLNNPQEKWTHKYSMNKTHTNINPILKQKSNITHLKIQDKANNI
jgi:hypothetical protein